MGFELERRKEGRLVSPGKGERNWGWKSRRSELDGTQEVAASSLLLWGPEK